MSIHSVSILSCIALFVGMLTVMLGGHRAGRARVSRDAEFKDFGTGSVDAAVLSLLGLLIAFTFTGAYARFDARRQLIVDEANAIGTAYLRLDLLPVELQAPLREKFRAYVHSRFKLWLLLTDRDAALREFKASSELQAAIWSEAIAASAVADSQSPRMLLLPAINQMIDITTTRLIAIQAHPPLVIFLLLGALALVSAWLTGFSMSKHPQFSFVHGVSFAVVASLALYVILDIEYPRHGIVRLDAAHQLLVDLEESMK